MKHGSDPSAAALVIITAGTGGQDERRARRLMTALDLETTFFTVDRQQRFKSAQALTRLLDRPWKFAYLEGTGLAGGVPLIQAAALRDLPYFVSSGDSVSGYFRGKRGSVIGAGASAYERLLYRNCAGFIGWTPYLTGRALELGAPRGATIEGGVDIERFHPFSTADRRAARRHFGLPEDHLVCGLVGTLTYSARQRYGYGLELVEVMRRLERRDVSVLIVGDGDGRPVLERAVPAELRSRIVFTGRLQPEQIPQAINAMDIGFVTQTLDRLGNYRLTAKLPEYLACGVPIAMSPVPGFFDYVAPAGWALPACHPGNAEFHEKTASWLAGLQLDEVQARRDRARRIAEAHFDYDVLSGRFRAFVEEVCAIG